TLLGPERAAGALGDVRVISVEALSAEELTRLAIALLPAGPAATAHAAQVAREAGGNAFFATELARHLAASGAGAGAVASSDGEISLEGVLRARLEKLPDDARRLLGTVAVAGRPIMHSVD